MPKSRHRKKLKSVEALSRPYLAPFYAHKELGRGLETSLKKQPLDVISYFLSQSSQKLFSKIETLLGQPFPKSFGEVPKYVPTFTDGNLEAEIRWTLAILIKNKDQINQFIKLRQKIEQFVLIGKLDEANAALKDLEQQLGISWWVMEMKLFLAQQMHGLEENRKLLKAFKESGVTAFISCIATFLSQRVENDITAEEFSDACVVLKPSKNGKDRNRRAGAYLLFRLNFWEWNYPDSRAYCLWHDGKYSIFDQYLSFCKILQSLALDNSLSPGIAAMLQVAANTFEEQNLTVLLASCSPKAIRPRELQNTVNSILNYYTAGDYKFVFTDCVRALAQWPNCLELYELACKAALRTQNEKYECPFEDGSLAKEIWHAMFNVIARQSDAMDMSLRQLHTLAYRLSWSSIGAQLHAFYMQHVNDKNPLRADRVSMLTSNVLTPRMTTIIDNDELALRYLNELGQLYPGNAAVKLFESTRRALLEGKYVPSDAKLPISRHVKYQAFVFESLQQYENAVEEYKKLDSLADSERNPVLKADAIAGQYRCLLVLDRIPDCARVLASSIASRRAVAKDTLQAVLKHYDDYKDDVLELKNISWPILFTQARISGDIRIDADKLHAVIDNFLVQHRYTVPTELKHIITDFSKEELVYFLKQACTIDVLECSPWFDSQEESEGERITICDWLTEMDEAHKEHYTKEVEILKKRGTIRNLTHKASESKIRLDLPGIKSLLSDEFYDHLKRALTYFVLTNDELRQGIELIELPVAPDQEVKVKLSDDGKKLFSRCLGEVRNAFLFSTQYGLDAILSQRIRHGTLSGEIRAQFEASHLLTLKNDSGAYEDNSYWLNKIEAKPEEKEIVAESLRQLSADVDAIVQHTRSISVQIRSDRNREGLLDYKFTDEQLDQIYHDLKEFSLLAPVEDYLFEVLLSRTKDNLQKIRLMIQSELKGKVFLALDSCLTRLDKSNVDTHLLRGAITACKTQLEHGLNTIADWFNLYETHKVESFTVSNLFDALIPLAEKYSGRTTFEVTTNFNVNPTLAGDAFDPLWHALLLLLNNAAEHSGLSEVKLDIMVKQAEGLLTVQIRNNLAETVDTAILRAKLEGLKESNSGQNRVREEGGSGYFKLQRILEFELKSKKYHIKWSVSEENEFQAEIAFTAAIV